MRGALHGVRRATRPDARSRTRRTPARGRAWSIAIALGLALFAGGDGRLLRPIGTAAQGNDIVARRVWAGSDVDFMGKVSPDGRYISFVDWETGDLAIRELRSGRKRRLTAKGSWSESAEVAQFSGFSPNGNQVAYAWTDVNSGQTDLRITGRNGGQPRVLHRSEDVVRIGPIDWSSDGRQLVTVFTRRDRTNQIVLVSIADGSTRVVKNFDGRSVAAAFSPDGRSLTYTTPSNQAAIDRNEIFRIATDGTGDAPLVMHPANDLAIGWSSDGTRLFFVSDRTGTNGIWTIRVSGGQVQGQPELVKPDIGRVGGWAGLTRNGNLYYGTNIGVQDVYTATLDPATARLIDGPGAIRGRFIGGKFGGAWSTGGEHVAYIAQSPQQLSAAGSTLSIVTLATGQIRDIPLELKNASNPVWLPDDRAVLVWGRDLSDRRGLYRVDLSTGRLERITPATGRSMPEPGTQIPAALSPDGRTLFYYVGVGQQLPRKVWMQNLDTGEGREIYKDAVSSFALSPDGQWLAVIPADRPVPVPRQGARIYVVPVSGGEPRVLTMQGDPERGAGPLAWSRDGRHVFFVRVPNTQGFVLGSPRTELWRVPFDGGAPQKLDIELPVISRVSVHPDGRRLAISAGGPQFEIWVLEGLAGRR